MSEAKRSTPRSFGFKLPLKLGSARTDKLNGGEFYVIRDAEGAWIGDIRAEHAPEIVVALNASHIASERPAAAAVGLVNPITGYGQATGANAAADSPTPWSDAQDADFLAEAGNKGATNEQYHHFYMRSRKLARQLERELAEAKRDVNTLNETLRLAGWGQGEQIDKAYGFAINMDGMPFAAWRERMKGAKHYSDVRVTVDGKHVEMKLDEFVRRVLVGDEEIKRLRGPNEAKWLDEKEVKKIAREQRMPKFMYDTEQCVMALAIFAQNVRRKDAAHSATERSGS